MHQHTKNARHWKQWLGFKAEQKEKPPPSGIHNIWTTPPSGYFLASQIKIWTRFYILQHTEGILKAAI